MTDETTRTLPPGSLREKIAERTIVMAKLPPQVPQKRAWEMGLSVIVGIAIFLVGCGILYAGLRVYVETKGGVASLPILLGGAVFCGWGGNHASKQVMHGGLDTSLDSLIGPLRKLARIIRGTEPR